MSTAIDNKIPNSYLFQPDNRQWMLKRGKTQMVYYDNDQIKLLKKYFESMGTDEDQKIDVTQLEEILISIGLVKSRDDVIGLLSGFTTKNQIDFQ
tara:strand:+ start:723 stop:1007 length:285 start_codon:yes stop_codon:yes gene_type:complete